MKVFSEVSAVISIFILISYQSKVSKNIYISNRIFKNTTNCFINFPYPSGVPPDG